MKKAIIAVVIASIAASLAGCNDKSSKASDSTPIVEKPVMVAFSPVNKMYVCDVVVKSRINGVDSSSTGTVTVITKSAGSSDNALGIAFLSKVGNTTLNIFPTSNEEAFASNKSLKTIVDKNFRISGLQFGVASVQYTNEVKMKSAEFLAWNNNVQVNVKYSNCMLK